MPAQSIYSITPTVLMVKKHNKTGLLYFCKTTRLDEIHSYFGSGIYWKRHLKEHGNNVSTIWVSDVFYDSSITNFATSFSNLHDIVNSKEWANLIPENGLDGYNKPETFYEKCCPKCEKTFETKNKKQKFCSKSCSASSTKNNTGKFKERKHNCKCNECGSSIFKFPSQIKETTFCSRRCKAVYFNKKR